MSQSPPEPSVDPFANTATMRSLASGWQRTSLWALLPLFLTTLRQMIGIVLGGSYLAYSQTLPIPLWFALGLGATLVIASALAQWYRTEFCVTAEGVVCRQGLWQRQQVQLSFARLQEIQWQQPLYFRYLSLFNLRLDSAGSQEPELLLYGLSGQQMILFQQQQRASAAQHDQSFFRLSLAVLYAGHLWAPLFAAWYALYSMFNSDSWLDDSMLHWSYWQPYIADHNLWPSLLPSWLQWPLVVVFGVLLLLAIMAIITLIWVYPQQTHIDHHYISVTQGTVLRKQVRLPRQRVQLMMLRQPLVARCLGQWMLVWHGFSQQQHQASANAHLVGLSSAQAAHLAAQLQPLDIEALQRLAWQPFADAWLRLRCWQWGVVGALSLAGIALGYAWLTNSADAVLAGWGSAPWQMMATQPWWWLLLLLVWCITALRIAMSYCWQGYYWQGDDLYMWQGGFTRQWLWLPLGQVQQVTMQQTRYFKAHQITTLSLDTANGRVTLPAVPCALAQALYARVLQLTQG